MIGKFSQRCLISTPSSESFELFNTDIKIGAVKIVKNVINRLHRQGVVQYDLLADTSLNVEVNNYLKGELGISPDTYNVLPHTMRRFWLENFSATKRLDLIFDENQTSLSEQLTALMEIEGKISSILKGDETTVDSLNSQDAYKFDLVKSVYVLTALHKELSDTNMRDVKHYYHDALFIMGVSERGFKKEIMDNLDSYFEEANKALIEYSQKKLKDYSNVEDDVSNYGETASTGIRNAIALMKAKARKIEGKDKTSIDFEFDRGVFQDDLDKVVEENNSDVEDVLPSLSEAFETAEGAYEATVKGTHHTQLVELEKLLNHYSGEVLKYLVERNNLLINFYTQTTDSKYKIMSNAVGNKFCLNVDLKTGEVSLTLKGQGFKLTPFFPNGEEIKVNAYEW